MHVRVVAVLDLLAREALAAGIDGSPATFLGSLAVQGFGQGQGEGFEGIELGAGEKIGMREAPALEGALEQLDTLLLTRQNLENPSRGCWGKNSWRGQSEI